MDADREEMKPTDEAVKPPADEGPSVEGAPAPPSEAPKKPARPRRPAGARRPPPPPGARREVSIFADPPVVHDDANRDLPSVRKESLGGDTIKLRSVQQEQERLQAQAPRVAPGPGVKPTPMRPPRLRPQGRVKSVSRKRFIPRNRFGPLSFVFGFFGLIFKMIFVTALVMGVGALISFMAIRYYVKTPEVAVPDVKGKRLDEAVKTLADKKLSLFEERAESSKLVAPGEVISQRPLSGTRTKEGTSVRVVVSSSRSRFVVPDVVKEMRENAVNKIRGAGLEIGDIAFSEDERIPKDQVISQEPEGGRGLDNPTKVNLFISSGPRGSALSMPDLSGRPINEARSALAKLGMQNVATEPADATSGSVFAQEPLVGKFVVQSQRVVLHVSPLVKPRQ